MLTKITVGLISLGLLENTYRNNSQCIPEQRDKLIGVIGDIHLQIY